MMATALALAAGAWWVASRREKRSVVPASEAAATALKRFKALIQYRSERKQKYEQAAD
jgi:hypothetical protein